MVAGRLVPWQKDRGLASGKYTDHLGEFLGLEFCKQLVEHLQLK